MNEDTKELMLWVESEDEYKWRLAELIESELCFIHELARITAQINLKLSVENEIKMKNVNGDEIYVAFCELLENEKQGWCRNENP